MAKLILIVEDEKNQRRVLELALKKTGFNVEQAASGHEALDLLSGDTAGRFDLVLLDMVIGDISGMDVLDHIRETLPNLPVIVLTGYSSIDNAVDAMRGGAIDFISKPVEVGRLKVSIENAFRINKLSGEISRLSRKWAGQMGFDDLIGSSEAMKKAVHMAKKGAGSNIPILLEGESGVGKEVFARAIQGESDRSGKAFVVVNCGAIPRNLVESILFGHEKGSFTGAMEKHMGKFAEADGGTLFLDEIGELPLEMQVKLLRVLQEGEVDPVGSRKPFKVDVRLISATNRHLKDMVKTGEFREDLFYRLNIFPIHLPPLRQRKGDIERLVPHFIENISISEGYPNKEISPDALELLKSCDWPGNVRQLENALFRAIILSEGSIIVRDDFPQINPDIYRRSVSQKLLRRKEDREKPGSGQNKSTMDKNILPSLDENGDVLTIAHMERNMIGFALNKYDGRMSEIARRLGIGRSTLYRKVAEFGLDEDTP
ncbi:MAG: sigma-54-dependent Fis family transcriptional regulator [Alphaproteobacteria bacterium]|nr:MAG: sigma-54-dependent Fis family transcriptional regulator [Alphaproteobacteria bacterium]